MRIDQWLRKLLPRQSHFYTILSAQTRVLCKMTQYLCIDHKPEVMSSEDYYQGCHSIEHEGDDLLKKMAQELAQTFITPLDREDLYQLAISIENAIDACDEAVRGFQLLNADETYDTIRVFLGLLDEAANHLANSVEALAQAQFAKIMKIDESIKQLEKKADDDYRLQISRLFREENDLKQLLIKREVIEKLEDAMDEISRVSTFLSHLAVKNA